MKMTCFLAVKDKILLEPEHAVKKFVQMKRFPHLKFVSLPSLMLLKQEVARVKQEVARVLKVQVGIFASFH